MASSAAKDNRKSIKNSRRDVILPALPLKPGKPEPRPTAVNQEHASDITSPVSGKSQIRSWERSTGTPLPEKEEEAARIHPPTEQNFSIEGLKSDDAESSRSGYSTNTQKAFSAPEPSSTPASETTNPPADQLRYTDEHILKVDLGGGFSDEHQNADLELPGDSPSSNKKSSQTADSKTEISPVSKRSAERIYAPSSTNYDRVSNREVSDHGVESETLCDSNYNGIQAKSTLTDDDQRPLEPIHGVSNGTPAALLNFSASDSCTDKPSVIHDMQQSMQGIEVINGYSPRSSVAMTPDRPRPNAILPYTPSAHPDQAAGYKQDPQESSIASSSSPISLVQHLEDLYSLSQDCDCVLWHQLSSFSGPQLSFPAHRIILYRSPVLRSLLLQAQVQQQGVPLVHVNWVTAVELQGDAIDAVLRYLYTDTILTLDAIRKRFHPRGFVHPEWESNHVNFVTSYGLAGLLLGVLPVRTHAQSLFQQLMSWNIVEAAIKRGLEIQRLGERLKDSNIDWFGKELCDTAFSFVSSHWEDIGDFELDTSQPGVLPSYLPPTAELNSYVRKSNSVLQKIQFGTMPAAPQESSRPSSDTDDLLQPRRAISAILVNLPYFELQKLFVMLQQDILLRAGGRHNVREVFETIIEEREKRRLLVLNKSGKVAFQNKGVHPDHWSVVGYQESIQSVASELLLYRIPVAEVEWRTPSRKASIA